MREFLALKLARIVKKTIVFGLLDAGVASASSTYVGVTIAVNATAQRLVEMRDDGAAAGRPDADISRARMDVQTTRRGRRSTGGKKP